MAMGIRKVGDDSGSVYDTEWYKESVVKAERGNREHIAKYDRSFAGIMAKADADDGGDDDGDIGKQADHHASTVADLLVEAGSFPHRAAALQHLLHKPGGQALLSRMSKKETIPMKDDLISIMKDCGGITGVCAQIVAKGSTTISEHALVDAATKIAAERYPELSEAQAFAKVYSDQGAEGRVLRSAINVAKLSVFDLAPVYVGGPDAMHEANDATEQSEAYAQLEAMASKLRASSPWLSAEQAFAKVFEDPRNGNLSAKAHRRPTAPQGGMYPYPR